MARPDPIEYAARLYGAIRAANFSPISFLAFGNAIKDGVSMRNMPRIAAEPFMRVVGEMLDLEEEAAAEEMIEAATVPERDTAAIVNSYSAVAAEPVAAALSPATNCAIPPITSEAAAETPSHLTTPTARRRAGAKQQ